MRIADNTPGKYGWALNKKWAQVPLEISRVRYILKTKPAGNLQ